MRWCRIYLRLLPVFSLTTLLACSDSPDAPTAPFEPAITTTAEADTRPSFVQVSGGNEHSCGITPTNPRLLCWGVGMFGDGKEFSYDPRPPTPTYYINKSYRVVSSGYSHTCAITTENYLFCWGRNFYGELGDGTRIDRVKPTRIGGTRLFRQVDAGRSHTCAIAAADNRAWCWGDNTAGKLGDGTTTSRLTPVLVAGGLQFREIAVGDNHTCAITRADKAFCWGSDQYGQIGNGAGVTNRTTPTAVSGSLVFRQLASMWDHTCGVTADRAYCWGSNDFGQLGDGSRTTRFAPRQVAGGVVFERVSVGSAHSCGESTSNRAWCWGANNQGQLGDGTRTNRLTPTAVTGGLFFRQLSTGSSHTCGVATSQIAYCWGWNRGGQLGDGTIASRSSPVPVTQTDGVHRASKTVIEADDPDPSARGAGVTVRYAVHSDSTIVDGRAPTGQVRVTDGSTASCTGGLAMSSVGTVTVARGSCTLILSTSGQVTLSATYSGDETFFGSSDTETHLVQ